MGSANELREKPVAEKPFDRKASDGNDHAGSNHLDLGVEPCRTIRDLGRRWNAVRDPKGWIPGNSV